MLLKGKTAKRIDQLKRRNALIDDILEMEGYNNTPSEVAIEETDCVVVGGRLFNMPVPNFAKQEEQILKFFDTQDLTGLIIEKVENLKKIQELEDKLQGKER